jgi:hypothetical protein
MTSSLKTRMREYISSVAASFMSSSVDALSEFANREPPGVATGGTGPNPPPGVGNPPGASPPGVYPPGVRPPGVPRPPDALSDATEPYEAMCGSGGICPGEYGVPGVCHGEWPENERLGVNAGGTAAIGCPNSSYCWCDAITFCFSFSSCIERIRRSAFSRSMRSFSPAWRTFLYSTRSLRPWTSNPFSAATTASASDGARKFANANPRNWPEVSRW